MLTIGARLGPYEITAMIGEGGMGQVFRARDTKLDRDVAIKILPEAFAHDAERLARFTREAKTLATLNLRTSRRSTG
jgi:serine/threonine protein kinase